MKPCLPRVLIVENDATQAAFITGCINALGFVPLGPVSTTAETQAVCVAAPPDLVIINAAMSPVLADSVTWVRHQFQLLSTPLIFLTETLDEASLIWGELPPQVMCVPKPYEARSLQRAIQQTLVQGRPIAPVLLPLPPASISFGDLTPPRHLFVRERGMLIRLEPALIACVETEGSYCRITMANGRSHSVRMPLRELMSLLVPVSFGQVHRSWMVNLQCIEYINPVAGTIHLQGGSEAPLGRSFRDSLFKRLHLVD